jgi:hypothetical protein
MSGSTILNYIYHLCALEAVASGIDDIIVQILFDEATFSYSPELALH